MLLLGSDGSWQWTASQVNRVKMAMAEGKTIVLVNHDNIYEALYDVLNQRYLVKRDPHTGATRRLLRLAIGSRSQLCVCHDDFKVSANTLIDC